MCLRATLRLNCFTHLVTHWILLLYFSIGETLKAQIIGVAIYPFHFTFIDIFSSNNRFRKISQIKIRVESLLHHTVNCNMHTSIRVCIRVQIATTEIQIKCLGELSTFSSRHTGGVEVCARVYFILRIYIYIYLSFVPRPIGIIYYAYTSMGAHKIPIIIIIFIVRLFERIPRPAAPRRYATACPGQRQNVRVCG